MTKTENYNLPQWAETDPVRREDFNQMCAKIETGLTDLRDDQSTLARLRRMGYDLYQAVGRCLGAGVPGVSLKGAALNYLTSSDELSRVSGMAGLSGGGAILGPSTAMTLDKLNAAIYSWESVEAPDAAKPAAQRVKFRSAFAGTITSLEVWYHRTSVNVINLPVTVRLYDLEANEYAYQSEEFTGARLTAATISETLTVSVPVELNHDYQLEVYTRGGAFYGAIGFGSYGAQALTGTVSGTVLTNGTVSEALTPETPVSQVVAVIHHTGGQVTGAAVNGEAMTPGPGRPGTSLRGTACTEQELSWAGELTGTAALTAAFQTDSNADMTVHDVQFFCV